MPRTSHTRGCLSPLMIISLTQGGVWVRSSSSRGFVEVRGLRQARACRARRPPHSPMCPPWASCKTRPAPRRSQAPSSTRRSQAQSSTVYPEPMCHGCWQRRIGFAQSPSSMRPFSHRIRATQGATKGATQGAASSPSSLGPSQLFLGTLACLQPQA